METFGLTLGSTLLSRQFETLLWMYCYDDSALEFKQRVHTNHLHNFMRSKPRIKKFADVEMLVGQGRQSTIVIASKRALTELEKLALHAMCKSALHKTTRRQS
jgi:hypothetical protein